MATRSFISVMHGDVYKAVYCHWDGYPGYVGETLVNHYNSVKANELVSLGDISSLGKEIGEKHDFDSHKENWTKFYGRDRGETDVEFKTYNSLQELFDSANESGAEYVYILKNDQWLCTSTYDNIIGLKPVLEFLNDDY